MIRGRACGNFPWLVKDNFYIHFLHAFTNLMVNNISAVAVQNTAEIIKGAADIQIRNINMPVLMGFLRLAESGPFEGSLAIPLAKYPASFRMR